jgi:hypothetical protein
MKELGTINDSRTGTTAGFGECRERMPFRCRVDGPGIVIIPKAGQRAG